MMSSGRAWCSHGNRADSTIPYKVMILEMVQVTLALSYYSVNSLSRFQLNNLCRSRVYVV